MSAKNRDNHKRYRATTVGFRVSPEESKQIDFAVSLSGITKQDYIVSKLLDRTIVVQGNCKVHRAVCDGLQQVLNELKRIEDGKQVDDELLSNIDLITTVVKNLYSTNAI
jgi:RecA-family ATPase